MRWQAAEPKTFNLRPCDPHIQTELGLRNLKGVLQNDAGTGPLGEAALCLGLRARQCASPGGPSLTLQRMFPQFRSDLT